MNSSLSYLPSQIDTGHSGGDTNYHIQENIGSGSNQASLLQQPNGFVGKGRKGRESTHEADRETDAKFRTQERATQAAFHDHAKQKRADHIDGQGAIRQRPSGKVINPAGDHVARDAT